MGCFNREMEPQITYQIEEVVAHSCEYKSQILQDTLGVRQMEMCYRVSSSMHGWVGHMCTFD